MIVSIYNSHSKVIRVQRNDTYPMIIPQICVCVRQVLMAESLFLDTRLSEERYITMEDHNDLPQCDVSAFTGPSIQKATFKQSELV